MKILVGYDGSNQAKEALNVAKKHAQAFTAAVYVVTSLVGEDETTTEDIRKAEEELEYANRLLSELGIPVETHLLIRGFKPGEDLLRFAEEHEIDEIIVGIQKTSAVGKLLLGSTARDVILGAQCPVVAVK
ncbi:MAG: universal stress protein [Thermodesulfobacteriota bacterium]